MRGVAAVTGKMEAVLDMEKESGGSEMNQGGACVQAELGCGCRTGLGGCCMDCSNS